MPRYCLKLEYDGTPFAGWQRQADALSVQQVVEEAIEKMCGEKVVIQAAGRTDSGVHALGQVVSFDLSKEWDAFKIREALNFHTKPHPVAIVEAAAVPDTFEARFSAIGRHYEYRILNRRGRPALDGFPSADRRAAAAVLSANAGGRTRDSGRLQNSQRRQASLFVCRKGRARDPAAWIRTEQSHVASADG